MKASSEVVVEIQLGGVLFANLVQAARRRKKKPFEVLADVIETVLGEQLFDAVLDDAA